MNQELKCRRRFLSFQWTLALEVLMIGIAGCEPMGGPWALDAASDLLRPSDLRADLAKLADSAVSDISGVECESPFICLGGACILGKCGNVPFDLMTPIGTGRGPFCAAVSDFDRDGRVDIVVSNLGDSTVSLIMNRGAGVFNTTSYPGESQSECVTVGDFNGDKQPDIAIPTGNTHRVAVFMNRGGVFGAPLLYPVGEYPIYIVTGDFNGDGKSDISIGDGLPDFTFMLNNGGRFDRQPCASSVRAQAVGVGDLNEDGFDDVAKIDRDRVDVCWGGKIPPGFPTTSLPPFGGDKGGFGIAVAELNGDSHKDIVTVTTDDQQMANYLRVYGGEGNRSFKPAMVYPVGWWGFGTLITVDLNGDMKQDIVVSTFRSTDPGVDSTLTAFLNQGSGKFVKSGIYKAAGQAAGLATGDFNGDGKQDLAVLNGSDNQLNIWLNKGVW